MGQHRGGKGEAGERGLLRACRRGRSWGEPQVGRGWRQRGRAPWGLGAGSQALAGDLGFAAGRKHDLISDWRRRRGGAPLSHRPALPFTWLPLQWAIFSFPLHVGFPVLPAHHALTASLPQHTHSIPSEGTGRSWELSGSHLQAVLDTCFLPDLWVSGWKGKEHLAPTLKPPQESPHLSGPLTPHIYTAAVSFPSCPSGSYFIPPVNRCSPEAHHKPRFLPPPVPLA